MIGKCIELQRTVRQRHAVRRQERINNRIALVFFIGFLVYVLWVGA